MCGQVALGRAPELRARRGQVVGRWKAIWKIPTLRQAANFLSVLPALLSHRNPIFVYPGERGDLVSEDSERFRKARRLRPPLRADPKTSLLAAVWEDIYDSVYRIRDLLPRSLSVFFFAAGCRAENKHGSQKQASRFPRHLRSHAGFLSQSLLPSAKSAYPLHTESK